MNKIIKLGLVAIGMYLCGEANAQYQITNGDFESWNNYSSSNHAPDNWNSFETFSNDASGVTKYLVNNAKAQQVDKSTEIRPKSNGSYSVVIYCREVLSIPAQGNLTLGRIHASSTTADAKGNNNQSNISSTDYSEAFSGKPDSIVVWVKFVQSEVDSDNPYAKISAVIHDANDYIVYGLDSYDEADTDNSSHVVAKASQKFKNEGGVWQRISMPFVYTSNTDAKYIIVNASTNAYPGKGATGDYLYIDDISLIYNSELETATYDGNLVSFTDGMAYINADYDKSKELALVSNGHAATIETGSHNETTKQLTITVKGDNISDDASNYHTYTIQFNNASADLSVKAAAKYGTFAAPFSVKIPENVKAYKAVSVTKYVLNLSEVTGTIPANTAVILESSSDKDITDTPIGAADLSKTSCTTDLLTGVYSQVTAPVGSCVLQQQNGHVGFYTVVEGKQPKVNANRAYITNGNGVKAIYFDEATAIKAINALTSGEPTEIYSASGARQDKLQKGMNIVKMADGTTQKILVK